MSQKSPAPYCFSTLLGSSRGRLLIKTSSRPVLGIHICDLALLQITWLTPRIKDIAHGENFDMSRLSAWACAPINLNLKLLKLLRSIEILNSMGLKNIKNAFKGWTSSMIPICISSLTHQATD